MSSVIQSKRQEVPELWPNIPGTWKHDVRINYHSPFNIEKLTPEKNPDITLEKGCNILSKLGLKWWVSQGTLLGFYRDKGYCKGDSDIDIEVLDADPNIMDEIVQQMPFELIRSASLYDRYFQLAFIDRINNVIFDVWFLYSKEDVILNYTDEPQKLWYPKKYFNNLSFIDYNGKQYPTPSDCEWYCEFRYGDSWNTPQYTDRLGRIKPPTT